MTCHLQNVSSALELYLISFLMVNPYDSFNHTLGKIESVKCYHMGFSTIVNIIIVLKLDIQYAIAQSITAMIV